MAMIAEVTPGELGAYAGLLVSLFLAALALLLLIFLAVWAVRPDPEGEEGEAAE